MEKGFQQLIQKCKLGRDHDCFNRQKKVELKIRLGKKKANYTNFLPRAQKSQEQTFLLNAFKNKDRLLRGIIRHRVSVSLIPFILRRAATARTLTSCLYTSLVNASPRKGTSARFTKRRQEEGFPFVLVMREKDVRGKGYGDVRTFVTLSTCFAAMLIPWKRQCLDITRRCE